MNQSPSELARDKVRQLLLFLKEFQRLKKPPVRRIAEYPWRMALDQLPRHPDLTIGEVAKEDSPSDSGVVDGLILRIRRPKQTSCPPPPMELKEWILSGWQQIENQAEILESRNFTIDEVTSTIRFDDDERRVQAWEEWTAKRATWKIAEEPARQVEAVYQRLYSLHGQVERESENVQLFLGDGMLRAKDVEGFVDHPVLLQNIELRFDPNKPEFTLVETDDLPELAMAFVSSVVSTQNVPLANTEQLAMCQAELRQNPRIHPLAGSETNGFLRRLINGVFSHGRFLEQSERVAELADQVTLRREPFVFLAQRVGSFATAIDAALHRLETNLRVPKALANLVGVELESESESGLPAEPTLRTSKAQGTGEVELLLTRPANPQQEQVIRQLDQTGMVLVQGPPGTGKTHTIANLVGHCLAQGKTILITSHTAKALRVVREKIVNELQPLCVSLLEADAASRQELQQAVNAISHELGATSQDELDVKVVTSKVARDEIAQKLEIAESALRQAIRDEYVDIVVGGEGTSPAQAARRLREWRDEHDWLPGPVESGAVAPLSVDEVCDLYSSNVVIASAYEPDLASRLPDLDRLPDGAHFESVIAQIKTLRVAKLDVDEHLWSSSCSPTREDIERLHSRMLLEAAKLNSEPAWFLECVEASLRGPVAIADWTGLIQLIETTCSVAAEAKSLSLAQRIYDLPERWSIDDLIEVSKGIEKHLRAGGGLGMFTRLFQPEWRRLVDMKIGERSLETAEDFKTIEKLATTKALRQQLLTRWKRQVDDIETDCSLESIGAPEEFCRQLVPRFQEALAWHEKVGSEIERCLTRFGLRLADYINRQSPQSGVQPTLMRWLAAWRELTPLLKRRVELLELRQHEQQLKSVAEYLGSVAIPAVPESIASRMMNAVARGDCGMYSTLMAKLRKLVSLREPYQRRLEALTRLRKDAPSWADAIAQRQSLHGGERPLGDVSRAWQYRQWSQELERRANTDLDALQRDVNDLSNRLQEETAKFVVKSTWAEQFRHRYSLSQRQALQGWLQTILRPGFATGVRSAQLKAQARQLLAKCRSAVPVWIMPLSRVAESFDFSTEQFDVVIIDEASQCDVLGLLPMMNAKEVVVVGDHEQVSPTAAFQNLGQVQSLINQFLGDIPNNQLYDGKMSIYHLAQTCFGSTIRLVEHFRCVPEIIQFSNDLCYRDIEPLRESQGVRTRPFVIAHRVATGLAANKVNEVEGTEVASLLVAATEQSEYAGKTMGVISLVGQEQAEFIDTLLRRRLRETEYAARCIRCGNPAEFQGDERHVVFLSMVESSDGTPLRRDREIPMWKQRYNVAASRAQDQLWVVHSLNPETELQPGDLRLRLIQHAQDPAALTRQLGEANRRAQSEFERQVIRRLTAQGYRLVAQWAVGAFSIDIVVFGEDGRKVAIECDGDRFHTADNLEDDYRRQLMLERLGWRFIRIRSSKFFQNPHATMTRVFERLEQLNVRPIGPSTEASAARPEDTELKERIIRRAAELRREWKEQATLEEATSTTTPKSRRNRNAAVVAKTSVASEPASSQSPNLQRSLISETTLAQREARPNPVNVQRRPNAVAQPATASATPAPEPTVKVEERNAVFKALDVASEPLMFWQLSRSSNIAESRLSKILPVLMREGVVDRVEAADIAVRYSRTRQDSGRP